MALVGVFALRAAYSTALALRSAPVASDAQERELGALRPLLRARTRRCSSGSDYQSAGGCGMSASPARGPRPRLPVPTRAAAGEAGAPGQPYEFDSVDAGTLDGFAYVIAPRSDLRLGGRRENFASACAPARCYERWRADGPDDAARTLEGAGAPGAPCKCRRRVSEGGRARCGRRGRAP